MRAFNFGCRSSPTKLCYLTCPKMGVITRVQLWGGGTGPLKFGVAKIRCDLGHLSSLTAKNLWKR